MSDELDPRIYFAAERTLLAWLRTGLAVIGLGFLVARFGLLLRLVRDPAVDATPPVPSTLIGVGLVLLGAIMIAAAAWQHTRFVRGLRDVERPARYRPMFGVWISGVVAGLGVILSVYLLRSFSP